MIDATPEASESSRKGLSDGNTWWWCLAGTVMIEVVCLVLRFGFGQESTKATASTIGVLTFGIRIHHGYIGLLLIPLALALHDSKAYWARWMFIAGVSLLASDLIHHFLILWPITGSPHFDLVYPS